MIKRVGIFIISLVLSFGSLLVLLPTRNVSAAITDCSVSMTPTSVDPGQSATYQFVLTNNDPDTIQWIRIGRPSSQFSLTSASANGWFASLSSENATYTGGGLDQGQSLILRVNATVSESANGTFSWSFHATDDPSGSGQFACSGNLSVMVGSPSPVDPVISNVKASNITSSSAKITWNTDKPAKSQVSYGKTSSYGTTTPQTFSYVTSHSVSLSGLSAGTGYHYKVTSVSEDGGSASSGDNTFVTTESSSNGGSGSGGGSSNGGNQGGSNNNGTSRTSGNPSDTSPPSISLEGSYEGVYTSPPTFRGTAEDNQAVSRVDYSIDNGQTWIPADKVERTLIGSGRRQTSSDRNVSFEFTPINLEDGDYFIVVRATDSADNETQSNSVKIIIDRLPPRVGGSLTAIGAQLLSSSEHGVTTSAVGIDQKITLSATGGPTEITLTATESVNPSITKQFTLTYSKSSGLWSGMMSFDHPGMYSINAKAVDGAGNETAREIGYVNVAPPASIAEAGSNDPIKDAQTTIYYYVPHTRTWAVWEAESYGQNNPQLSDERGRIQYFLPAGKYYMKITAKNHRTAYSKTFEVDRPTPLSVAVNMKKAIGIGVASFKVQLPISSSFNINIGSSGNTAIDNNNELVDKKAPEFSLPATNGTQISSDQLLGKSRVISFASTWSQDSKNQLSLMSRYSKETKELLTIIILQEPLQKVQAYKALAGYELDMAVDKTGEITQAYGINHLPTHLFVDKNGFVKKVMFGVLSEEEIKEGMGF